MSKEESKVLAVIRIRSMIDQPRTIRHALKLLNLMRTNHAVIVPNDATHRSTLQKLKDVVTWGEVDKATLTALIKKRGRIVGNQKLDAKFLKEHKFATVAEFITAVYTGKADMRRIEGMKPLFRLHPPRKGFKSVKNPVTRGGDLGYRGEKINALLERMI